MGDFSPKIGNGPNLLSCLCALAGPLSVKPIEKDFQLPLTWQRHEYCLLYESSKGYALQANQSPKPCSFRGHGSGP